jgi:hypothetical protein
MSKKDQPPAPPASPDTSAPDASPSADRDASPSSRSDADKKKPKEEPHVRELIAHHCKQHREALAAATDEKPHQSEHPTVHEFAERLGLHPVDVRDALTGEMSKQPHWKVRAVLGWFRQHGLDDHARIPTDVFEKALHEALHGRI